MNKKMEANECSHKCHYLVVLDTETTGLDGSDYGDVIVELAMTEVCLDHLTIKTLVNDLITYPPHILTDSHRDSWVFRNTDLTFARVIMFGSTSSNIRDKIMEILEQKHCVGYTTYNTEFDYDKFLKHSPWSLPEPLFCLMKGVTPLCKLPKYNFSSYTYTYSYSDSDYKYPKLYEAYQLICKKDTKQNHRALDDTLLASKIFVALVKNGNISINPETYEIEWRY